MQALWHINKHSSELRNISLQKKPNSIRLAAKYSLISTGTERLVAMGKVPTSLEPHMRVPYMGGSFQLPVKYGYSMIASTPENVLVHSMHPHQAVLEVAPEDLYEVPPIIPAYRLPLISNMETIINAIWDSEPTPAQKIAICGFGNIGSLLANTLRVHFGIEADIIELNPWRSAKAEALEWNTNSAEEYDIIYHTTATNSGLQYCIKQLKTEGRIIELSWYGDEIVHLTLGHEFHYKRLQLISSQVATIPLSKQQEYDYKTRKDLAVQWLMDASYDALISDLIPFKDSPAFFNALRKGQQGNGLIWIIEY